PNPSSVPLIRVQARPPQRVDPTLLLGEVLGREPLEAPAELPTSAHPGHRAYRHEEQEGQRARGEQRVPNEATHQTLTPLCVELVERVVVGAQERRLEAVAIAKLRENATKQMSLTVIEAQEGHEV